MQRWEYFSETKGGGGAIIELHAHKKRNVMRKNISFNCLGAIFMAEITDFSCNDIVVGHIVTCF